MLILKQNTAKPAVITRRVSSDFNVSESFYSSEQILQEQQLYPFHVTHVQNISWRDYKRWAKVCQRLIRKYSFIKTLQKQYSFIQIV